MAGQGHRQELAGEGDAEPGRVEGEHQHLETERPGDPRPDRWPRNRERVRDREAESVRNVEDGPGCARERLTSRGPEQCLAEPAEDVERLEAQARHSDHAVSSRVIRQDRQRPSAQAGPAAIDQPASLCGLERGQEADPAGDTGDGHAGRSNRQRNTQDEVRSEARAGRERQACEHDPESEGDCPAECS